MHASDFMFDNDGLHFFTGLETYSKFVFVLSTLGPAAHELQYFYGTAPNVSIEDQFFITCIKLRLHKTNFELSRLFHISERAVTNTFVTWVNFMAVQWSEVDWWPSPDVVHFYSPQDFASKYPTTRCIIDGTECPIAKPKNPLAQQATFSHYKNRNTVKVLVGCSPGGLVNYVSPAYGGSASDRQIVERSTLPQMCSGGDSILADKGFNVQDIFEPYDVKINMPSFFKKKNRLSNETLLSDRKIASKRVHIERIIGLGKTFKILKEPMNRTECALACRIIRVCFILCNFKTCIVPKTA